MKNNDYAKYAYRYWLFKGIVEEDGDKRVKLYNGKEYIEIPYEKFKERFTDIVFNVKDFNANNLGNSTIKAINKQISMNC